MALLACGLAAACALAGATAQASDETAPVAQTLAPTGFAGVLVVLHGTVDAGHQRTTYWFEVGPTTAYGSTTQPVTIDKDHPVPVSNVVSGLLKGATYHARLVARNGDGLSLGADVSFTSGAPNPAANAPTPPPGSGTGAGDDSGSGPASGQDPASGNGKTSTPVLAPPAPPELGETLGAAPQGGNVLVRLPGSTRAVALTDAASIPVGSILDARKGTVALSSALPGDDTQTGNFHGGLFEVRQPTGARGMTELILRGPQPICTGAGAARAAGASARRPPRGALGPRRSRALPHARQQQRRHRPRHGVVRRGPLRRHADARQQGQRLGPRPAPPAHRHRPCRPALPRAQRALTR